MLSRGVAVVRGTTLIVNLPGSPSGATEAVEVVRPILEHAVATLHGGKH
jgi:molybdopterin biosynthesis enzyme MoaB